MAATCSIDVLAGLYGGMDILLWLVSAEVFIHRLRFEYSTAETNHKFETVYGTLAEHESTSRYVFTSRMHVPEMHAAHLFACPSRFHKYVTSAFDTC